MITERVVANGLKPGNQFWVVASMLNVGELPAIIKNTKMTERIVSQRVTYSEPMTWKDINDADVIKPPGTFPVGAIGPGQRIGLPLQSAAVSAEVLKGIMDGSFFLYVFGGVEYETRDVVHHTVFCGIYEPSARIFVTCGGGID
jgi:hypothetical protein